MSDSTGCNIFILAVCLLVFVACFCMSYGIDIGRAQATCYAAHLRYVETTSAGVVCGEPAVLLPILTEVKP